MNEWSCKMASSHLSSSAPRYSEALDFGRTMPLRHPPVASVDLRFNTSQAIVLPFSSSCPQPVEATPSAQVTAQLSRGNCLVHPFSSKTTESSPLSSLRSNPHGDKKRWQTADYRWMFTKRKGTFPSLL